MRSDGFRVQVSPRVALDQDDGQPCRRSYPFSSAKLALTLALLNTYSITSG